MKPSSRGMTLVEILISIFVFGLFTTLMATALVSAYRNQVTFDANTQAFRQTLVGLNKMEAELQTCMQVYSPDPTTVFIEGATINPTPASPFTFQYQPPNALTPGTPYTPAAPLKVSYALDKDRLERIVYDAAGNPTVQLISTPVLDFSVTRVNRKDAQFLLCVTAQAHVPTHNPLQPAPVFFEVQLPCIAPNQ